MPIHKIPTAIKRTGYAQVQTAQGECFPIGITPMHVRLDAARIGYLPSQQLQIGSQVAKIACELTVLPHLRYMVHIGDGSHIQGIMPSFFFEPSGALRFVSKAGISASQALESVWRLHQSSIVIECTMAVQLIFYRTMMQCLGIENFNRCFKETGIVVEASFGHSHPLYKYLTLLDTEYRYIVKDPDRYIKSLQPGDMVYISNIPQYAQRHPLGDSKGFNVIYVGRNAQEEAEFGGLFSQKYLHSYNQIINRLVDDYNKVPYGKKHIEKKKRD